jgi:putative flippase GtrA
MRAVEESPPPLSFSKAFCYSSPTRFCLVGVGNVAMHMATFAALIATLGLTQFLSNALQPLAVRRPS